MTLRKRIHLEYRTHHIVKNLLKKKLLIEQILHYKLQPLQPNTTNDIDISFIFFINIAWESRNILHYTQPLYVTKYFDNYFSGGLKP